MFSTVFPGGEVKMPVEPTLSVGLEGDGGTCVLSLSGQLNSRSAIGLQTQVDQLHSIDFDGVVIDAAQLTSVDAVGMSILRNLCRYAAAKGRAVRVKLRGPGQTLGDGSLAAAERRLDQLLQQALLPIRTVASAPV